MQSTSTKQRPAERVALVKKGATAEAPNATRLVSKREVLDRIGVSYPTLWSWMRDGRFPRSRELGGKICWLEREIEKWIDALPMRPLKGDQPQLVQGADAAARAKQEA
jgi:prophage regulatory protein